MTTGPARRLPAPRPALRKAADAGHHPAAGPSVSPPVAEDPVPEAPEVEPSDSAPARPPGPTHSAAATAFWDALQSDAAAALQRNGTAAAKDGSAGADGEPRSGSSEELATKSSAKKPSEPKKPSAKKHPEPKRSSAKKSSAKKKFQGATSDVLRKDRPEQDLLLGKQANLEVRVPKRLRKAATAQAERHGTTLDNVVTGLLAGWVDGS